MKKETKKIRGYEIVEKTDVDSDNNLQEERKEMYDEILEFVSTFNPKELTGDILFIADSGIINKNLEGLFKQKVVFINVPNVSLNEDGELVQTELQLTHKNLAEVQEELDKTKLLFSSTRVFKSASDFENINAYPYVYVYSVGIYENTNPLDEKKHLIIRYIEPKFQKKKVTFTLTDSTYNDFSILADKMAINKSKFIENTLKDFIIKNK